MVELQNQLIDEKSISLLARKYSTLDYSPRLVELLNSVCPSEDFSKCSKFELHLRLNTLLSDYYHGEHKIKYKLFQYYLKKRQHVSAFEIKVNNSRADFLSINSHTTCFEIKSELDNFSKFSKQATDYLMAFEFNILIVDDCHTERAKDIIPSSFGLWAFKDGRHKEIKKAMLNDKMRPEVQLRLLSKKELQMAFQEVSGNLDEILKNFDSLIINERFKNALKNRYRNRWSFLVENQANILPVDVQFFFQTELSPKYVYQC